jgi:hypothetical protein
MFIGYTTDYFGNRLGMSRRPYRVSKKGDTAAYIGEIASAP